MIGGLEGYIGISQKYTPNSASIFALGYVVARLISRVERERERKREYTPSRTGNSVSTFEEGSSKSRKEYQRKKERPEPLERLLRRRHILY